MAQPGDIKSPRVLKLKGFLFAAIGLISAGMLIARDPAWQTVLLCGLTIWAWCRFYYFLFYVLENYAGRTRPYAGVLDALKSFFRSDRD
jgi:hypothetical protein